MSDDQINRLLDLILPTDADHAVHALIELVEAIADKPNINERQLLSTNISQQAFARTSVSRDAMQDFINAPTEPDAERDG